MVKRISSAVDVIAEHFLLPKITWNVLCALGQELHWQLVDAWIGALFSFFIPTGSCSSSLVLSPCSWPAKLVLIDFMSTFITFASKSTRPRAEYLLISSFRWFMDSLESSKFLAKMKWKEFYRKCQSKKLLQRAMFVHNSRIFLPTFSIHIYYTQSARIYGVCIHNVACTATHYTIVALVFFCSCTLDSCKWNYAYTVWRRDQSCLA